MFLRRAFPTFFPKAVFAGFLQNQFQSQLEAFVQLPGDRIQRNRSVYNLLHDEVNSILSGKLKAEADEVKAEEG